MHVALKAGRKLWLTAAVNKQWAPVAHRNSAVCGTAKNQPVTWNNHEIARSALENSRRVFRANGPTVELTGTGPVARVGTQHTVTAEMEPLTGNNGPSLPEPTGLVQVVVQAK